MAFDEVKDSGERREASTGAVRDRAKGKGRYDLLPPFALQRLAKHYENGAIKYSDRNWEKGLPLSWFLDSAIRHAFQLLACRIEGKAPDEDHAIATAWNMLGYAETEERIAKGLLPSDLDDLPKPLNDLQKPDATPLVPARRGGTNQVWQRWQDREFQSHGGDGPYLARNGQIYLGDYPVKNIEPGDEIRVPYGYDGPCPEGCYWIDEDGE